MFQDGEIWPNTTAQFSVVFRPEEAELYQQTIYLDVTGQGLVWSKPNSITLANVLFLALQIA